MQHTLRYLPADIGAPLWGEACREFVDSRRLQRYSDTTLQWYTFVLNPFGRYLHETMGIDDPAAVQEGDVLAFLNVVGTEGLGGRPPVGAKRLNDYREGLSLFFDWLQERGYVADNPVQRVKKIRQPRRLIETFTEAQVKALLEQPNHSTFVGVRDYCFILTLLDTGMRLSEGLSLKVEDLDLDDMTAKVMGKGHKERRLGLSPRLLAALKPYLRKREVALARLGLPDSQWVFPNDVGGRLVPKTMQQHLKKYGAAAGIRGVRVSPHTLRHTYALTFVRSGGDPFTLQKILGHTSLEMSRRYCELGQSDVLERQRELTPLRTMDLTIRPHKRIPRADMSSWGKPRQRIRRRAG